VDRSNKTILLNFVNEFDLVARSSKSYIRSLVDLFRSIYTLPPIHDHGTIEQDWKVLNGFGPQFEGDGALPTPRLQNLPFWNVPSPELFHVGPIVALKAGYSGKSNAALAGRDWDLRAFSVPHEEFSKLLFCRVSVHARQIYVENLNDISKGLLNGGTGWNYKMIHDD
jgi:hypothetical protein